MTPRERLRQRLARLVEKTKDHPLPKYSQLDTPAGKRQVLDDDNSGRLAMTWARIGAELGLAAFDDGEVETAAFYDEIVNFLYTAALETRAARVRPSDAVALDKPAKRRGRPRKRDFK